MRLSGHWLGGGSFVPGPLHGSGQQAAAPGRMWMFKSADLTGTLEGCEKVWGVCEEGVEVCPSG